MVVVCSRCGCMRTGRRTPPRPATVEGITEPALLILLSDRSGYGYQLRCRLAEQSFTPAPVSLPRVYEALQRLERDGAIAPRRENSPEGPDRQRYAITPAGRLRLERWVEALRPTERSLRVLLDAYEHLRKGGDDMGCCCAQRDDSQRDTAEREEPVEDRVARLEAELAELKVTAGR